MIAYFPGVWDCVHAGHVLILNQAKKLCLELIIGVCSDELNKQLKNKLPLFNQDERCLLLNHLGYKTIVYETTDYKTHCYYEMFIHGPEFGQRKDQKEHLVWCIKNDKITVCLNRIPEDVNISTTEIIRRAQQ